MARIPSRIAVGRVSFIAVGNGFARKSFLLTQRKLLLSQIDAFGVAVCSVKLCDARIGKGGAFRCKKR